MITFSYPIIRIQFQIVQIQIKLLYLLYRKEIIKDNYVRELNPQIAGFAGLEWGQKG